jgi:hypothetical protein
MEPNEVIIIGELIGSVMLGGIIGAVLVFGLKIIGTYLQLMKEGTWDSKL